MNTIIGKIDKDSQDRIIAQASEILSKGGIVAFPTETVYGLGGNAYDGDVAKKIYAAKGRPSDNPLIVHIACNDDLEKLSDDIPDKAWLLAEKFWPGPLTMILKKNDRIPYSVTGGLDTVGIRMPSHPVANKLIAESGIYLAAPSANLSGRPSPTKAEHVIEDLSGRIDMIIDAGNIDIGLESTIVDLTCPVPTILRPGYITFEMLKEVLGDVELDKALMTGVGVGVKPKAPGMKYRHYAPKAQLTIVEGNTDNVINKINEMTAEEEAKGHRVGIMTTTENVSKYQGGIVLDLGSVSERLQIANHLFDELRQFDTLDVDCIFSEGFSEDGLGQAIMNRLVKAAGHKIINV